jgi:hypothetical protein
MQTETGKLVFITKEGKTILVAESDPTVILKTETSSDGGLMFIETQQGDDAAYILVAAANPNLIFGFVGHLEFGLGFFQHEDGKYSHEVELPADGMFLCDDIPLNQHALRYIADFVERKDREMTTLDESKKLNELGLA